MERFDGRPAPIVITGFNHNVRYKNILFHIQTEDSGQKNPHVITHLFIGGNIVSTTKTSYADIIRSDRLEEVVREIMQEQHKGMMKSLLRGDYDGHPLVRASLAKAAPSPPGPSSPAPGGAFGGDVLTDKSLDEVILDYLAGDSDKK